MGIFRHGEKRAEREAEEVLGGVGWHELPVRCERDGREVRVRLLAPHDPGPLPAIMWAGGDDVAVKLPLEELAARGVASCVVSMAVLLPARCRRCRGHSKTSRPPPTPWGAWT